MPIYPVINPDGHRFSFTMLLGNPEPSEELLDYTSVDQHVDADSVPAFIMHTFADQIVDVKNTLSLATAYANAGIPFEMHIYPKGGHGASLGNAIVGSGLHSISGWIDDSIRWMNGITVKS
jgi:dipeptidyl aminopeptidase/acylaminoacyl peptidase